MSLLDRYIRRRTYIERTKVGLANDIEKKIRAVDNRVLRLLKQLPLSPSQQEIDTTINLIRMEYSDFINTHYTNMVDLSKRIVRNELNWFDITLKDVKLPDIDPLFNTVLSRPYQNRTLNQWSSSLITDKINRMITIVNSPHESKTERAFETRRALNISNHNVKTITKTYPSHFLSQTHQVVNDINELSNELIWVSVLDSRTSMMCMVRSNKRYDARTKQPIGHNNIWGAGPGAIHFNCRSIAVPKVYGIVDDLDISYNEWLKKQSPEFIMDTLGNKKGQMFLNGKDDLQYFVVPNGRELTIDELENKGE